MSLARWRRQRAGGGGEVALNVIPLIDVVFFLLVFYVMASTFLREETVAIERPSSASAAPSQAGFVPVAIARDGGIHCNGPVGLGQLPEAVRAALGRAGATRCVVVADGSAPVQSVLAVMDACRSGGATAVELAASGAAR